MNSRVRTVAEAATERIPTRAQTLRLARTVAAAASERYPSSIQGLAEPPAGSGLKPVLGDYGMPIAGHMLEMLADTIGYVRRRYDHLGPISWSGFAGGPMVTLVGPDAIGEAFANRDKVFLNEPGWSFFIGPFFRRGVMLMDGDEHRYHRRIMQQAFKNERLREYLSAMNPAISRGLDAWGSDPEFLFYWAAKKLTLDIATEVFVGAELDATADRLNKAFVDAVHGGMAVVRHDVPGGSWHRGLEARLLERYFRDQLPAKRAGDGNDLFSALCHAETDDGERFSDEDVVNHMIFLLMAAHDTSTITLAMMVYLLGRHPEWQERLRAESRALGKEFLEYDDLDTLSSLDLAFRETLRYNAPVGAIVRQTARDSSIQGHFVPANTKVVLNIYGTQRMEQWWSDPDRFDPERFAPDRREDKSHKYAWMPFGGGVHKCIGMHFGGMEVKAIMHRLLLRFRWTVPVDYETPIEYGTGPLPGDGLPVKLIALS